MTCLSERAVIVGQTPPKIEIVDRACFILTVLHIFFEGLSKSFTKIFSPLIEE